MVYTSSSLALAALEYFVNLPPIMRQTGQFPPLLAVALDLPDDLVPEIFDVASLPKAYGIADCQKAGDKWSLRRVSLALMVPSHVIPSEANVILNPRHTDMQRVTVYLTEEFRFDDRMGG